MKLISLSVTLFAVRGEYGVRRVGVVRDHEGKTARGIGNEIAETERFMNI